MTRDGGGPGLRVDVRTATLDEAVRHWERPEVQVNVTQAFE
jgi:hypothetical protein